MISMEIEQLLKLRHCVDLQQELKRDLLKKYRIAEGHAEELILEHLRKDTELLKLLSQKDNLKHIQRTRSYKNFRKRLSERTYYALRQYNQKQELQEQLLAKLIDMPSSTDSDVQEKLFHELAATHLSTKERLAYAEEFYQALEAELQSAKTILDVGCGLHPLMFPFQHFPNIGSFTALERDQTCSSILRQLERLKEETTSGLAGEKANVVFSFHQWQLNDAWQVLKGEHYDLAFLLKLVPVVARQDSDLLMILAEVPADRLVISGSLYSMTKQQRIDRRERKVISRFIKDAGREVLREIVIGEELIYIVA